MAKRDEVLSVEDALARARAGIEERTYDYSVAHSLYVIAHLLWGVVGDRGSVVDVRVSGSVSTGDQR